ncbi:GNAT family N-acetyltransferase [Kribbella sandramycini]|uniref:GNAT family N-acetyltransferase n=1 Tax=Kribbella sandramycini TaxID=60450 RepID=A0A7Y4L160_9ACTN|nr:GNAT family N-acetyltransferase [Kribbella sandramycini]MBB6564748.1 GNAT superfamily N-acetyltransferase [Kribbella sandramycini]NOL42450.1 GNAT family N-acetyltransferase [Kribbella sandramycini]
MTDLTPPAWRLRPATPADVEPIAELRAVVLRPDLTRLGRYDAVRVRQRLRDGFDPTHTRIIEVAGRLAGCIALRPADDTVWLEHFYLDPTLQGRGVGTGVLTHALATTPGPIRLNVLQGSPARRLYERHGFTLDSEDAVDVYLIKRP